MILIYLCLQKHYGCSNTKSWRHTTTSESFQLHLAQCIIPFVSQLKFHVNEIRANHTHGPFYSSLLTRCSSKEKLSAFSQPECFPHRLPNVWNRQFFIFNSDSYPLYWPFDSRLLFYGYTSNHLTYILPNNKTQETKLIGGRQGKI